MVPALFSLKVALFTLLPCIGSEKVTLTLAPGATPLALFAGVVLVTLGDALSITWRVKVPRLPLKPSTRIRYVVFFVALNVTLLPSAHPSSLAATSVSEPRALPV